MNMTEYKWIETLTLIGLSKIREDHKGNKLETYGDIYDEHDKVMASLNNLLSLSLLTKGDEQ